jgi:hypothetical protein
LERIGDQTSAQDVQDAGTRLFLASSIVSSEKSAHQKRPYLGTTYNWPAGVPVKKQVATLFDGIVAGLFGALAVALWFLIFDFSRGEPFQTPALLGAVLLNGLHAPTSRESFASSVVEYSVVHFAVFALFGLIAAWLVTAARRRPALLFTLVLLFAGFELFFVALIVFWASPLLSTIPWLAVLVANLLATAVMLAYFFVRNPDLGGSLLGAWLDAVSEGMIAGLLGGAIVATWFLLIDLRLGQPLRTPALLGAALFSATPLKAAAQTSAAFIVGYTVLHFAAFAGFGILVALLLAASERQPMLRLGLFLLFGWLELFFVGFLSLVDYSLLEVLTSSRIVVGNVLSTVGMVAFFYSRHRGLGAWRLLGASLIAKPRLGLDSNKSTAGKDV